MARTFQILGRVIGASLLCAVWLGSTKAGVITAEAGLGQSPTAFEEALAPTEQSGAAAQADQFWSRFAGSYSMTFGLQEASGSPFWPPAAIIILMDKSAPYDLDVDDPASDLVDDSGPASTPVRRTKSALHRLRPQSGGAPDHTPNWTKDLAIQLGITTKRGRYRYNGISLDGDVAEIGFGAGALRSIHNYNEISLLDDAAMTGLTASRHNNQISLSGDASEIVFAVNSAANPVQQIAAVGAKNTETLLVYLAGLAYFLSSRDALPYFLVVFIGYVAFAGIRSLIVRLR
jgi:hypothetical protein